MSPVVIGVVVGVWSLVCLVVLAACWGAKRGDEALTTEARQHLSAVSPPVPAPGSRRWRTPFPGSPRRSRLH
jgi:hypothetical protein